LWQRLSVRVCCRGAIQRTHGSSSRGSSLPSIEQSKQAHLVHRGGARRCGSPLHGAMALWRGHVGFGLVCAALLAGTAILIGRPGHGWRDGRDLQCRGHWPKGPQEEGRVEDEITQSHPRATGATAVSSPNRQRCAPPDLALRAPRASPASAALLVLWAVVTFGDGKARRLWTGRLSVKTRARVSHVREHGDHTQRGCGVGSVAARVRI
jgi:hypothetical protein